MRATAMRFRYLFLMTEDSDEVCAFSRIFPSIPTHNVPPGEIGPVHELYIIWKRLQRGNRSHGPTEPSVSNLASATRHYNELAVHLINSLHFSPAPRRTDSLRCLCIHDPGGFRASPPFPEYLNFILDVFPESCILFVNGEPSADPGNAVPLSESEFLSPDAKRELAVPRYSRLRPECMIAISRKLLIADSPGHPEEKQKLASFLGLPAPFPGPSAGNPGSDLKSMRAGTPSPHPPPSQPGLPLCNTDRIDADALIARIDHFLAASPKRPLTRGVLRFRDTLEIARQPPTVNASMPSNKIVWGYWDDGEANAPEVVRLCFSRWRQLNPEYSVRILSRADLDEVFRGGHQFAALPVAAFSDLLRIHLLATFGGVWTDATVLPLVPLSLWLPAALRPGFFAFSQGRDLMVQNPAIHATVASWFLAAQPDNLIASRWYTAAQYACHELVRSSTARRPLALANGKRIERFSGTEYWWFHQAFTRLLASDPEFRDHWMRCWWWPMQVPHLLGTQKQALQTHAHRLRQMLLRKRLTPLLKLSAKYDVMKILRYYRILDDRRVS